MYYTGQPSAARKLKNQMNMQQGHSDSDKTELMSTSEAGASSEMGDSDEESSATFETVAEKDVRFSSKKKTDKKERANHALKKRQKKKRVWALKWNSWSANERLLSGSWRNMSSGICGGPGEGWKWRDRWCYCQHDLPRRDCPGHQQGCSRAHTYLWKTKKEKGEKYQQRSYAW